MTLMQAMARLLFLPILLVALSVLVKGYATPGDGFSAGVIASLGVALQFLVFGRHMAERLPLVRWAPLAVPLGLLLALIVAFAPVFRGQAVLTHSPAAGEEALHLGSIELVTALAFDVGVFLIVFGFTVTTLGAFLRAAEQEREP